MLRCIRLGAAFRFDLQCRLKTPPRLSARYGTDASTAHPPPSLPPIPQGRRNRTARVLTNLDPERLDKADFFDFSGITGAGVQVGDRGKFKFQYAGTYDTGKFSMRPFPPATRGFLYYHQPSHLPVGAGEIRFRLTPSDRPSSFAAGADLLLDGIPWRVPLLRLSHTQTCAPLRQMLLDGGLITPDALESTRVVNDRLTRFHACNHTLHSLGQPFTLRFRTPLQKLWSIGPSHCINFRLQGLFQDQRGHKTCYPYSGSASARFELSDLPQHADAPTLVIRILDILNPVQHLIPGYSGSIPVPEPGVLVSRRLILKGQRVRAWQSGSNVFDALRIFMNES